MSEFISMFIDFLSNHIVAVAVIIGLLLIVSGMFFSKVLSKRKQAKKSNDYDDVPHMDELEKMYMNSLKIDDSSRR